MGIDKRKPQIEKRGDGTEEGCLPELNLDGNGAINFVLANIGQGSARNVKFSFVCDEEIP